jgi:chaperonin GroES
LGRRIKVLVDEELKELAGGLSIPETARERPQFGTVLAIGPEVNEAEIKDDDRIMFGKMAGIPMKIGDELYYVMHDRDVFMVLDKENDPTAINKFLA